MTQYKISLNEHHPRFLIRGLATTYVNTDRHNKETIETIVLDIKKKLICLICLALKFERTKCFFNPFGQLVFVAPRQRQEHFALML